MGGVLSAVSFTHIYLFCHRLSDENASVRLTAITVLTQLVLKDVMKVKGQVSEVAVLLLDPEPHIASLALNFFNELAGKVCDQSKYKVVWLRQVCNCLMAEINVAFS